MALTEYVMMPGEDYQAACDMLRSKTGKTDLIKSGDLATEIEAIGAGIDFDPSDEQLKYFAYQLDPERRKVILLGVRYALLYEDTGSYDVTILNTLGGWAVEINSLGVA